MDPSGGNRKRPRELITDYIPIIHGDSEDYK